VLRGSSVQLLDSTWQEKVNVTVAHIGPCRSRFPGLAQDLLTIGPMQVIKTQYQTAVVRNSNSLDVIVGDDVILFQGDYDSCLEWMRNNTGWTDLRYIKDGKLWRLASWVL
jgi:hypothetical protein